MIGNAWEWTSSLHRSYPYDARDGREDADAAGRRVLRGGSFRHDSSDVACAAQSGLHPDSRDEYIGFRVAADDEADLTRSGIDWVGVPAGPFLMGPDLRGSPGAGRFLFPAPGLGGPRHTVELAAFQLSRVPVTNARYADFVADTGARPPDAWEGARPPQALLDHPVTSVDWHEARAFCTWAGVRLPTEAEWERAAAGPDGRRYPWGNAEPDPSTARFGATDPDALTMPVGGRPSGASAEGALDLAGNVWEWTSSLHRPYPYDPTDGREEATATGQRVLRGGSFRSPATVYLRCAFRSRSYPSRRRDHIGFRVARSVGAGQP